MDKNEIKSRIEVWKRVQQIIVEKLKHHKMTGTLRGNYCFCHNIITVSHKKILGMSFPTPHTWSLKKDYPEMWKYKPRSCYDGGYFWSPSNYKSGQNRVKIIDKIINDLQKQL